MDIRLQGTTWLSGATEKAVAENATEWPQESITEKRIQMQPQGQSQYSANDLVPSCYQNVLIFWRDKIKQGYFAIGDIANELIKYAHQSQYKVTQEKVFSAVGSFVGKSGRTVRYYAETAEFFPVNVREEFEVAPFSHFVFSKSMGDRWREVLEYSAEHPMTSEDGLRMHFLNMLLLPANDSVGAYDPMDAQNTVGASEPVGAAIRDNRYGILSRISNLQENTNYLRYNLLDGLKQNARSDVERALTSIDDAVGTLLRVVDYL